MEWTSASTANENERTLAMMSSELKEAVTVTTRGAVLTTALRERRAWCDAAAGQIETGRCDTDVCHRCAWMHRPEALWTRWTLIRVQRRRVCGRRVGDAYVMRGHATATTV